MFIVLIWETNEAKISKATTVEHSSTYESTPTTEDAVTLATTNADKVASTMALNEKSVS